MKIKKVNYFIIAMAILFTFTAQPVVQAGQNLTIWPIESVRGDSSTGSLTIYYLVVGWDEDQGEELVMMFFVLRLYEKKTKDWHFITAASDATFRLTFDAVTQLQQQELQSFFNGPVRAALNNGYTSVHLTAVENDFENLSRGRPPYAVGADITIVAK